MNPERPLRILAIVNLPWDPRLGASRVWIELEREWKRAGHTVEKFCLTDAFPKATRSRAAAALRDALFPGRAAKFVRDNRDRFDVIDCLIGTLPFSKDWLGWRGLLVARSVGLFRIYNRFQKEAEQRWPDQPRGRWFGRWWHSILHWCFRRDSETALQVCDLVNVPNEQEKAELETDFQRKTRIIVQPYGLSKEFTRQLAEQAAAPATRLRCKKICFIGTWSLRKGSYDWPKIAAAIWQQHPTAEFLFLGTMTDSATVRAPFGSAMRDRLQCHGSYDVSALGNLLSDCTLGLFPSYCEGFGLAVLEQLAAGLPTVAYNVAGPRGILASLGEQFLTPVGDPAAIAARACELLQMTEAQYQVLSAKCQAVAATYNWEGIAEETIAQYRMALDSLGNEK